MITLVVSLFKVLKFYSKALLFLQAIRLRIWQKLVEILDIVGLAINLQSPISAITFATPFKVTAPSSITHDIIASISFAIDFTSNDDFPTIVAIALRHFCRTLFECPFTLSFAIVFRLVFCFRIPKIAITIAKNFIAIDKVVITYHILIVIISATY